MKKGNSSSKRVRREQPRKDNRTDRVNFDNTRIAKFDKDMDEAGNSKTTKRTRSSNDVAWYASNPELLKSAASVPFSDVTGQPFTYAPAVSVPGVMTMLWVPNVGGFVGNPLNQAANQIYSDTVHANSRNQSYDAPDEMLIILAGAQVFSALAMGIRAYGLMRRYNQNDLYTPEALLQAQGFSFSDLKANFSNMWFDLNQLITQTRQIWIPNVMPLIQRWYWMNTNIYKDGSAVKAQYYQFVQATYFKYDETTDPSGGSLQPIKWIGDTAAGTVNHTWTEYVQMVDGMIEALIQSQDRGIIFGDILKAYGADKLYAMSEISADYMIEPIYDREVLSQIENATVFQVPLSSIGGVYQENTLGRLYQLFSSSGVTFADGVVTYPASLMASVPPQDLTLNFHQLENPTPEQIMVATRLTCAGVVWAGQNGSVNYIRPGIGGTEVICRVDIAYNSYSSNNLVTSHIILPIMNVSTSDITTPVLQTLHMFLYDSFDWAPGIQILNSANTATGALDVPVYPPSELKFVDYDNFALVKAETINKMHITAIYSEFGVKNQI